MSTATSRREQIIAWVVDALEGISTDNNFRTDAGASLYVGVTPDLSAESESGDPEAAIALVIGDDDPRQQGGKLQISLPFKVCCLARANSTVDAWQAVEALLADVKEAIEVDDRTLGGLITHGLTRGSTRTADREPGSKAVGAEIEYMAVYPEAWGEPTR